MLMSMIRWPIGRLILLLNVIFSPKSIRRSADIQAQVDESTAHLALYQLPACPFCVKVRRAIKRNGLNIELRNINKNQQHLDELLQGGGKRTVPCLAITESNGQVNWLYESKDIVHFLGQFSPES